MVMIAETITAEAVIMAEATAAVIMVVMMNAGTGITGVKYTIMW